MVFHGLGFRVPVVIGSACWVAYEFLVARIFFFGASWDVDEEVFNIGRGETPKACSTHANVPFKHYNTALSFVRRYPNQRKWREKCQHVNPDWEFRLYNDSENRALLEEHFPWFLPTYDNYPNTINRVDAIRIFYLAKFGGIYMDLDYT